MTIRIITACMEYVATYYVCVRGLPGTEVVMLEILLTGNIFSLVDIPLPSTNMSSFAKNELLSVMPPCNFCH